MSTTADATNRGESILPAELVEESVLDIVQRLLVRWVLKPLASLRLTVALFVLCMFLVLCGTLAQVDMSNQAATQKYFRSIGLIWIPLKIFFPRSLGVPFGFPYPGGWLLGAMLLVNLLAAHITRFRLTWQRSGIFVMHAGVILLLLGELVTGLFSVEARMEILEESSANYVYVPAHAELAVVEVGEGDSNNTVVIPDGMLKPRADISHPDLPFYIRVDYYMVNSKLFNAGLGNPEPMTLTQWSSAKPFPMPEATGTDEDQPMNVPAISYTLWKKGADKPLAKQSASVWLEQMKPPIVREITVDGKKYEISLRFKRVYKPYTIHLTEFHHDKYVGTPIPKDFKSEIKLVDPSRGENRNLAIWMNNPLRHAGETFYQAGFRPDNRGTILQVVQNPGWLIPYIACTMVALGMLFHFGLILIRFLIRVI